MITKRSQDLSETNSNLIGKLIFEPELKKKTENRGGQLQPMAHLKWQWSCALFVL